MTNLIELSNISMTYGASPASTHRQRKVLDNLSLAIRDGDRLGIVGRNGSGKSTLLRIIAKIFSPDSGQVIWSSGTTVSLLSLGVGFRNELTGRENAMMVGMLQGLTKGDAKNRLSAIEEFCDIGDYFDAPVKTYSAGMRARLGFATALLNSAGVILIDEVLSVGDRDFTERARKAINQKISATKAIVLVSHSEPQILNICNRAIWLDQGAVANEGSPGSVLESYK